MKKATKKALDDDRYFSMSSLADYLDKSLRWVSFYLPGSKSAPKIVKTGAIKPLPGYKIGKSWLFKKSEVDEWIKQFDKSPAIDGAAIDRLVNETLAELVDR